MELSNMKPGMGGGMVWRYYELKQRVSVERRFHFAKYAVLQS